MRIRVRVPQDGEEKPVGLFGWLKGLFTRPDPPTPPAAPAPTGDKRWAKHGSARYFTAGRLCVRTRGQWLRGACTHTDLFPGTASKLPASSAPSPCPSATSKVRQCVETGAASGLLADAHTELHAGPTRGLRAGPAAGPASSSAAAPAENLRGMSSLLRIF